MRNVPPGIQSMPRARLSVEELSFGCSSTRNIVVMAFQPALHSNYRGGATSIWVTLVLYGVMASSFLSTNRSFEVASSFESKNTFTLINRRLGHLSFPILRSSSTACPAWSVTELRDDVMYALCQSLKFHCCHKYILRAQSLSI